jgi:hypothetical protein
MLTGLNDVEAFEYFNGVETELVEIRPERIADLSMDCKILLSKYKGEQTMAQSMQGVQVIQQFYSQPYEIQVVTAKFYRMMIKALDMNIDADEVIQPVGAVSGQAPGQPALNPQQAIEAVTPKPSGMPTPNL